MVAVEGVFQPVGQNDIGTDLKDAPGQVAHAIDAHFQRIVVVVEELYVQAHVFGCRGGFLAADFLAGLHGPLRIGLPVAAGFATLAKGQGEDGDVPSRLGVFDQRAAGPRAGIRAMCADHQHFLCHRNFSPVMHQDFRCHSASLSSRVNDASGLLRDRTPGSGVQGGDVSLSSLRRPGAAEFLQAAQIGRSRFIAMDLRPLRPRHLADVEVAVAVHGEAVRRQELVGRAPCTPMRARRLPVWSMMVMRGPEVRNLAGSPACTGPSSPM